MTSESIDLAARELVAARNGRRVIDRLSPSCRPANNDDALAIQARVTGLLNERVGGWKCSLPRGENAFLAPLLASTIRSASPFPVVPRRAIARIEPEVAFVLGTDLPPRAAPYTEADIRTAIAEARLVLEIIGSRYSDETAVPFSEFLADSINNQGLFLGPVVENALDRPLEALTIVVSTPSGTSITHDGRHPSGHPLLPLLWLANFLSGRVETLQAGCIVTTGSYAGVLEVPLDTPLSVSYGDLGRLEVMFEEDRR